MDSSRDEVTVRDLVRGSLRELRWLAPFALVTLLALWTVDAVRGGPSVPFVLVPPAWVAFTLTLAPLIWVRYTAPRTRGWWRALALATLWPLVCLLLLGIGYGIVVGVFGLEG